MSGYGSLERRLARLLDRTPRLRGALKTAYQRLNHCVSVRGPQAPAWVHPRVPMHTAMSWAGLAEADGECFFGYYDKSPWSPDMRYLLLHHPVAEGMAIVVLERGAPDVRRLGTTPVWTMQQGSQATWLAAPDGNVAAYNDMENGQLGCRLINLAEGTRRFIPWPLQAAHPNGREAVSLNYHRLHAVGTEYGYAVAATNFTGREPLDRDGLWRVDLDRGAAELLLSLAHLAANEPRPEMKGAAHYVNHALYSPTGRRIVFMHRWHGRTGRFSRLYVCDPDGRDLRLLLDDRMVSHYHWEDDEHLLVWGRTAEAGDHYYRLDVRTGQPTIVGAGVLDVFGDGHPSYSPDRRWIVTDSYPDRARYRRLLLFGVGSGRCIEVGRFLAPWAFDGARRCDLHPRWSPDGQWISIDSAHEGRRGSYLLAVGDLLGSS